MNAKNFLGRDAPKFSMRYYFLGGHPYFTFLFLLMHSLVSILFLYGYLRYNAFILFREESMTTLKDDHLQCNGVLKGVNIFEVQQH